MGDSGRFWTVKALAFGMRIVVIGVHVLNVLWQLVLVHEGLPNVPSSAWHGARLWSDTRRTCLVLNCGLNQRCVPLASKLPEEVRFVDRTYALRISSHLWREVTEWGGMFGSVGWHRHLVCSLGSSSRGRSESGLPVWRPLQSVKLWSFWLRRLKLGFHSFITGLVESVESIFVVPDQWLRPIQLLPRSSILSASSSAHLVSFCLRDLVVVEDTMLDVLPLFAVHLGYVQEGLASD